MISSLKRVAKKGKAGREFLEELMSQQVNLDGDTEFLEDLNIPEENREGLTYNEVLWTRLLHKALGGDMKAIQEVLDRRFGKAQQHILNENLNYNYTDLLKDIREADEKIKVPQVIELDSPNVDRGSSENAILEDLGF